MSRVRATYAPVSAKWEGGEVHVTVRDLDGPVSVTNDAEAVVREIYFLYCEPTSREKIVRIFYYDTQGQKDELLHEEGKFTGWRSVVVKRVMK